MKQYFFQNSVLEIPEQAVIDCSMIGANDDAVESWWYKIDFTHLDSLDIVEELAEMGAWTRNELLECNRATLEQRLLWVACHSIKEDFE